MAKKKETASTEIVRVRHGDIVIDIMPASFALPEKLEVKPGFVLVEGEATGHAHRYSGEGEVLRTGSTDPFAPLFVRSNKQGAVSHEEHKKIAFPEGSILKVTRKRQYTPEGWRAVAD